MWQRKTPADIRRIEHRAQFAPVYTLVLFAATVMTLAQTQGYRGKLLPPFPPQPFSQAFGYFPAYFICMFLFLYLMQVFSRIPRLPGSQCYDLR